MHFLMAKPGMAGDEQGAVDLGQSPADIIFLSAADTDITVLARAHEKTLAAEADISLRLANLDYLAHPASVDLYLEKTFPGAHLVVIRLLGGESYWPYGFERITDFCKEQKIDLVWLPGDLTEDETLADASTVAREARERFHTYLAHGGAGNAVNFLKYCSEWVMKRRAGMALEHFASPPPAPMPQAGLYKRGHERPGLDDFGLEEGKPVVLLIFYRALLQADNMEAIDALIASFEARGLLVVSFFAAGLKIPMAVTLLKEITDKIKPDVICMTTGFALSDGYEEKPAVFKGSDAPVIQIILSGGTETDWRENKHGLSARDIVMNIALPEMDGRITTRAISFKDPQGRHALVQADIVRHQPLPDRCDFVSNLAARWASLRRKPTDERHIALILGNYPHRDGRLANGVGLDSPASAIHILKALKREGYDFSGFPEDSASLMAALKRGPTNQDPGRGHSEAILLEQSYQDFFDNLPEDARLSVIERWGDYRDDPFFRPSDGGFMLPFLYFGKVIVGLQAGRGYNMNPDEACHDPELVPPHGYLAFYIFLRRHFKADAIIHLGKHGTVEWLPGKALALSANCWPDITLGAMPIIYPFIVNDPGEGSQAKRRTQSVVIDHMTPPLSTAGSHGLQADLEILLDEYYEACNLDKKRARWLEEHIVDLARQAGLLKDAAIEDNDNLMLEKLDGWLCSLKELQIRSGLHIFGLPPEAGCHHDLLKAMLKNKRGPEDYQASLHCSLAEDFGFDFNPLDYQGEEKWLGPFPSVLGAILPGAWRTKGDTAERLDCYALGLLKGELSLPAGFERSRAILETDGKMLGEKLSKVGDDEMAGLLKGLSGRFVPSGPSGAPTRGRVDVLPTGRNFWSVDNRAIPSRAAWDLGWKSATLLLERHLQSHGVWPRHMALSAWGTACMRTGGEDIAQMLALMGVRPCWEGRRVTGFEILSLDVLGRPRVDVTLRISGFFRDAFPGIVEWLDEAVRAVVALDEPAEENPLAEAGKNGGEDALIRIFGPKPGTYGTGIQALMDQSHWQEETELAESFIRWGGYGFGQQYKGVYAEKAFRCRLENIEAVIHNQDNREHDILDSDDYYQFEGGLGLAARHLGGKTPVIYHNDHSNPDAPKISTLPEEIALIVRARATNPRWIKAMQGHGYKGAFEMAATVDYLFAFAVTARAVKNHHFDLLFEAYVRDDDNRAFMLEQNPDAFYEMLARFDEAQQRNLWQSARNDTGRILERLRGAGPNKTSHPES